MDKFIMYKQSLVDVRQR